MRKINIFPETVARVMPRAIHSLGGEFEKEYFCRKVLCNAPKILGESFAKHVKFVAVDFKVLKIYSAESTWANEALMHKEEIIQKANNTAGRKVINDIKLVGFQKYAEAKKETKDQTGGNTPQGNNVVIKKFSLQDNEKDFIKGLSDKCADEDLQRILMKAIVKQRKMNFLRGEKRWHDCPVCGMICPPERKICFSCEQKDKEEKKRKIREYLLGLPWSKSAEVAQNLGSDVADVNYERAKLVQTLALKVKIEDWDSLTAKTLVMLCRLVQPEELTEKIIKETLFRLRYDLVKPADFKSIKRYEYVPWGKKKR